MTELPDWLTGPNLASHPPPISSCMPLAVKPGRPQPPPEGVCSTMRHTDPAGTCTVLMPGVGSTTEALVLNGPLGPLQVSANR